ncbi:DUF6458 family protein [Catelliglobosispora koreensis]|uniref:DUF6458 family protein n=1 Tax=Catelliglobosispora koreensis TaxID=129052 RepID=UPI00037F8AB6
MGIGASIFLIALGAILTWAVDWSIGAIDINVIGAILMVAGVGGLILFFYFWNQSRVPEAVTAVRQRQVPGPPRAYNDAAAPPATVTPPQPQPATVTTVMPQQPHPATFNTVTATAPVPAASQSPRQGD